MTGFQSSDVKGKIFLEAADITESCMQELNAVQKEDSR
jgi:hypothetical protein